MTLELTIPSGSVVSDCAGAAQCNSTRVFMYPECILAQIVSIPTLYHDMPPIKMDSS
jgi:hypothetical protein